MSHYRKIDVRIWNDAKFQALSDAGKLVFFLLLTHPNMTALGAMRGTPDGLAAELKDLRKAFLDAFREVIAKGMAEHDEKARLIALPNFVKYNPPTSPNVVKAWVNALEYLPECELKAVVVQRAVAFAEGMSKGFAKAIPHALREAMRYPLSIEHRALSIEKKNPSQGGKNLTEGTTGTGTPAQTRTAGKQPRLAVVNGAATGDGQEDGQ